MIHWKCSHCHHEWDYDPAICDWCGAAGESLGEDSQWAAFKDGFEQVVQNAAVAVLAKRGLSRAEALVELERLRQIPIAFAQPTDEALDQLAAIEAELARVAAGHYDEVAMEVNADTPDEVLDAFLFGDPTNAEPSKP